MQEDLHGVAICHGAISTSHLLFADDYFLFFKASISEVNTMQGILEMY